MPAHRRHFAGSDRQPTSTYGLPVHLLVSITGVHIDTARRWKRRGFVPGAFGELVALRTTGDLAIVDRHWTGFRLHRGALITPDGWDIQPGEVTSLPIRYQQLREFERLFAATSEQVQL